MDGKREKERIVREQMGGEEGDRSDEGKRGSRKKGGRVNSEERHGGGGVGV